MRTVALGTGHTVIRVYDKVAEIGQNSGKAFFFELWGQTDGVWRIEFRLRRERLKRAGIGTLGDIKERQNDVLRELAIHHTTLRAPLPDSNRSRWPLHPLWRRLGRDIAALPQWSPTSTRACRSHGASTSKASRSTACSRGSAPCSRSGETSPSRPLRLVRSGPPRPLCGSLGRLEKNTAMKREAEGFPPLLSAVHLLFPFLIGHKGRCGSFSYTSRARADPRHRLAVALIGRGLPWRRSADPVPVAPGRRVETPARREGRRALARNCGVQDRGSPASPCPTHGQRARSSLPGRIGQQAPRSVQE